MSLVIYPSRFRLDDEHASLFSEDLNKKPLGFTKSRIIGDCMKGNLKPIKVVLCAGSFYLIALEVVYNRVMTAELPLFLETAITNSVANISRPYSDKNSIYFFVVVEGLLYRYRCSSDLSRQTYEVVCEGMEKLGKREVNSEFTMPFSRTNGSFVYGKHKIDFDIFKRYVKFIRHAHYSACDSILVVFDDKTCVRIKMEDEISFSFVPASCLVSQDIIVENGHFSLSSLKNISLQPY